MEDEKVAISHISTVGPCNTSQDPSGVNQLGGTRFSYPSETQQTDSADSYCNLHGEGVQEIQQDYSKQLMVGPAKSDRILSSILQAIEEKNEEIRQLKKKIDELQSSADSKEEQYRTLLAEKEQEIESIRSDYEAKLAVTNRKLEEVRDQAAKLKQDNQERENRLMDELKRIKKDYDERIKELTSEKEVECLKLQLRHEQETKKLELHVKDLQCQLEKKRAEVEEKKALVAKLEKEKIQNQLEEQKKLHQAEIGELKEKHKIELRRVSSASTSASPNQASIIGNASACADTLQSITEKSANLNMN